MKKTENNLATKADIKRLDKKIDGVEKGLRKEMGFWGEQLKEYMQQELTRRLDKLLGHVSAFAQEIEDSRQERILVSHRVGRHDEKIEDHEERIGELEKHTLVSL